MKCLSPPQAIVIIIFRATLIRFSKERMKASIHVSRYADIYVGTVPNRAKIL